MSSRCGIDMETGRRLGINKCRWDHGVHVAGHEIRRCTILILSESVVVLVKWDRGGNRPGRLSSNDRHVQYRGRGKVRGQRSGSNHAVPAFNNGEELEPSCTREYNVVVKSATVFRLTKGLLELISTMDAVGTLVRGEP
jgi:hypothetical protein